MSVVIVGAGQAGFQTAISLRSEGYAGAVTLVDEEPESPYNRPPLSKAFLLGKAEEADLAFRPPEFYQEHGIALRQGQRVVEIDRGRRQVRLSSDELLDFETLVLATGARVRQLAALPADTLYLRTLGDARQLRDRLSRAQSILVVGAGFIGLEVAAAARAMDKAVKVVAADERPMSRVVSPEISAHFAALHQSRGVELHMGRTVTEAELAGAGVVVAGIGVIPNTELARDAGLEAGDGIAVDEFLRTTKDAGIFAIGDCAAHPNRFLHGGRGRLESIQNAVDQARIVAAAIAGKPAKPYRAVPWFWSDQYETKLQIAGNPAMATRFVRRGGEEASFSVFGFVDDRLVSVESINRPVDHIQSRKLLEAGTELTPDQAADPGFLLKPALRK